MTSVLFIFKIVLGVIVVILGICCSLFRISGDVCFPGGLSNFYFHPGNKKLQNKLRYFGMDSGPEKLFIYGEKSTGKSHLAACMQEEMSAWGMPCITMNYSDFAKNASSKPDFLDKVSENYCLILDTMETLSKEPELEQMLFAVNLKILELNGVNVILLSQAPLENFMHLRAFFDDEHTAVLLKNNTGDFSIF